jgi:pilus assembly protein CpaB
MRGSTVTMFLIALFFGGLAVFLANFWLRAQQPAQVAQTAQPAKVEIATIVVAAKDLKFGEALNEEILREIPWPKASVPDGAFGKIADITKDGRRVVLTAISPNEPILKWKISGAGARASLSALVNDGMRAVTVRVNDSTGVAGFVLPGDRVDVLYTRDKDGSTIDILLQNVRVLAINQTADEKKSEPINAKVATLELTPIDAQKISLAQATGSLTLTLRSAGSLDRAPAQRIVENELVSNPSVYQTAFDAQAAAQAQLNARLKGLEGSLSQVEGKVLTKVEGSLSEVESKLLGKIESADASRAQLMAKLAGLESIVQQTAKATGEGEVVLRKKLADLEAAIRKAGSATGVDEKALRARLAEFEASLRKMMAESNRPITVQVQPAADTVNVEPVLPTTANIKVYRGMSDASYTVPLDANPQ